MGVFSSRAESGRDLARLHALMVAVRPEVPAGLLALAGLPAVLFGPHARPGSGPHLAGSPRHDGRRYRRQDAALRGAAC